MKAIYQQTVGELRDNLASGDLSSVDIVTSLIERRQEIDPGVNAFTQINESAVDDARRADEALRNGDSLGPLHGIPVTIKDNIDVQGYDATMGLRSRQGKPATRDAALVTELRRQGVVILGKTNVPQLLLAQETENEVFGVTANPWDHTRVPGGSSGGEAAAVATGMSPLGIGTDIGGSIRIPAHFCGIAGLKPTLDRWSNRGSQTAIPGQEVIRSQTGPLARTCTDLSLVWSALSTSRQAGDDPSVAPLAPAPADVAVPGLRIGVYSTDDLIEPVPAIQRAVMRAAQVLEEAGGQLVEYQPTPSADVLLLWMAAVSSDGGTTLHQRLGGEAASPQLKPSKTLARIPGPARRLAAAALDRLGEKRLARLLEVIGRKPVEELWRLANERTVMRRREFDAWTSAGIDVLLCPAHVVPAIQHRKSADFTLSIGPAARWNLLDFPAGIVPVTTVRPDEETYNHSSDRLDAKVGDISAGSTGLPVAVQVVARPFCEHLALSAMLAIEAGVAGDAARPQTPVATATNG